MKNKLFFIILFLFGTISTYSQTLAEARELYLIGEYEKALPAFETEYNAKPTDASLNQWYGVCLFETGKNLAKAEECLIFASKRKIRDSFYYLGKLYSIQYRFDEAETAFNSFQKALKRRGDEAAYEKLEAAKKEMSRLRRMVNNTEDIQIIDSIVIDKSEFLDAYMLSLSSGSLKYFNDIFSTNTKVESVVYTNEKETKIYFAEPGEGSIYQLFSMEKLIDKYGNEKALSNDNFGLGNVNTNYPFLMPDGVTIYFAATDEESIGGYDLFVSRYNMNNDTYLNPERLSMPFNSVANDYMMAIDEEKGVGWFASDRFQPEGSVCVYTFIPNTTTKTVESENMKYKAKRAIISSIKDSWIEGVDYTNVLSIARKPAVLKERKIRDFTFIINDSHTYYNFSDFKNKDARDTYFKVAQIKSELQSAATDLQALREKYIKSSLEDRRQMSNNILTIERKVEQMQSEINQLELQARNEEVKELNEAIF